MSTPAASSVEATPLTAGFMVVHGNRLEDLRDLLAQFLQSQPLPVLSAEVILVQSNGMKHWLEMALASDAALGISAATRMELPGAYLWQVYRAVLGAHTVPQHMPFDKSSLVWRLQRLLPALAARDSVYAPLQRYLQADTQGLRLYQLALQVADVLDGYQSYRADWLGDWAQGHDLLRAHDGRPQALPDADAWQAQLWRDLRTDVGEALADASRAHVHARFMAATTALARAAAATGRRPDGLPPRIIVFGISSLPMQTVEALAALGQFCQVLMLVHNPCQHYWGDIVEGHDRLKQLVRHRQQAKPVARLPEAAPGHAATHPLLASWGKQGRDYLHLIDDYDRVENYQQRLRRVDVFVDPVDGPHPPSRLALLQSAILNLQAPPDTPQPLPLALAADQSITLVTTHAAQRELEVLHDQLLAWFDADPALQPRDVMVMVPDMEAFAPHIQAVFGRFTAGQPRHIPYAVADTTPRQSPLVQALTQLLSLPTARVTLNGCLSLLEVSAVRKRFGLSAADVAQAQDWLAAAGVRWGLDAQHRAAWGVAQDVAGLDQNTWAFGLRRLLLGYAVGAGQPWGGTLPQPALGGLDARLLAALLAWTAAIAQTLQEIARPQPPAAWGLTLLAVVQRFFLASDDAEERVLQQLQSPIAAWLQLCENAGLTAELPLDVVREHWLSQIQDGGLHQRFFGGGVQFGTLMPMRSIPFPVICLLGMNDGDYPRQKAATDFDLMAQSWRAGDRSRREDDRYLFLEALLSARQKLYLSWQGHSASDNSEKPPSVLVAQLIDYLNACHTPPLAPARQPLQAFSASYFLQGSSHQTYDQDWARVHDGAGASGPAPATADTPLPEALPTAITLDDLRQLLRQPVEVFIRGRLRVRLDGLDELAPEEEPFALDGLENYLAGQDLLDASDRVKEAEADPAPDPARGLAQGLDALRLSGRLPMAAFGQRVANGLRQKAQAVLDRQTTWRARFPLSLPAQSIALTVDGVSITGTLTGLWSDGAHWLQLTRRVGAVLEGAKDRPAARAHIVAGQWLQHVLASACGMPLTSVQLGLDGQVLFPPLAPDQALAIVRKWLGAYRAAWASPMPLACKTGWAYLQAAKLADTDAATDQAFDAASEDGHAAAQAAFEGGFLLAGERADSAYLSRAFTGYADIAAQLPHWALLVYGDMARHARAGTGESA